MAYLVFKKTIIHPHKILIVPFLKKSIPFLICVGSGISLTQGRIQGEGHPARAPPKIGKNMIFWRKIVIFHTKYPKNYRTSLRKWKKYDFLA
jgi:hypothetical protein